MAFREMSLLEMASVSGGYWQSVVYDSNRGEGGIGYEWINDPVDPNGLENYSAFLESQSIVQGGMTVDNYDDYLAVAGGLLNELQNVPLEDRDYNSVPDAFAHYSGASNWYNNLSGIVPVDATMFGHAAGPRSLTGQDLSNLGINRSGVFTAEINGIPVQISMHRDVGTPDTSHTAVGAGIHSTSDITVIGQRVYSVSFSALPVQTNTLIDFDQSFAIPSQVPLVGDRHFVYANMNSMIQGPDSVYHTNFFAAAANVTGISSLWGATVASNITSLFGSGVPFSSSSIDILDRVGSDLYKYVNVPAFNALYSGNSNFILHVQNSSGAFVGVRLGDIARGGTSAIDVAMVMNEQYNVQLALDRYSPAAREQLRQESNTVIHSFADSALQRTEQKLGHSFNFGNVNDRIRLGYNEIIRAVTGQ